MPQADQDPGRALAGSSATDMSGNAVSWAIETARTVAVFAELQAGDRFDPARLRPDWVQYTSEYRLVRLDVAAVDLLHRRVGLSGLLSETS